ncbi:hypothetical protein O9993_07795 [Vibrio lentus]|nr:hypothetical protein [Vibrio lentus]
MRTLDIGGDKRATSAEEDNPFPWLAWRSFCRADHPDIFIIQLRAMLRASCDSQNLVLVANDL